MKKKYQELKNRLAEISHINSAIALLTWDQSTYMPPKAGLARGKQLANLTKIAHEKSTDAELGKLLDELQTYSDSLDYDSDEASLIRVTRRNYEHAVKVPVPLMAEQSNHSTITFEMWKEAHEKNDFSLVQPYLEKTLDISRRIANCFPNYDHIADPLISFMDYGLKATEIKKLFATLREELVPLVESITAQPETDDSCLRQFFHGDKQLMFSRHVSKRYGYDLERGRQDLAPHPFVIKVAANDVRLTSRFKERYLAENVLSTMHETGHALYEFGINPDYEGTPLNTGASVAVHESQSRLWENIVGRSKEFWEHFYPQLQAIFPEQLESVPLDTFYRALNKVRRSYNRVEADEVTYNLHVMIRFDFELDLLEGKLAVKDLPKAWQERYESDLGVTPPSDADGVLQDIHWFAGMVGGYFQGYTLGNILSGQFYKVALKTHPEITDEIGAGQFTTLHSWLKENIYRHGQKYTTNELIKRVTGDDSIMVEPERKSLLFHVKASFDAHVK
ncbi:MAG: carboxypeptidase [Anaerolineaceae bacterium 4572_78]|nr:MAG: carboxypeptidase [Anaerolineaceae bacterium 4572_78]